ncbi:DUF4179 domain-containing protein [Bacillus sp. FJAT-45350]|uniref:DUF4179 domain-containing protein n=1 Tax=Bacillus sp. FJAT-45350 TaxID=2011014 RepID=UPI000BB68F91|nr:DUF4179 domain-containing protein [Bacillus sp. FJAT-45350]
MDEQELKRYGQKKRNQEVPEQIDMFIQSGIEKARFEKVRKRKAQWTVAVACLFLITMVTTVRVSPVFANYIGELPGGKYFVELVHFDKGLKEAIEHDYATPINESDKHLDLKWTVEGMTIDESRMVLFYSVENMGDVTSASMREISFTNELGEGFSIGSVSYGNFHDQLADEKISYGKIDVNFMEDTSIPDELTVEVEFQLRDKSSYVTTENINWSVTFPINKETFIGLKEEYEINEETYFANQRMIFKEATIYPTRMSLKVQFDETNLYKIFRFEDLMVVNENGERWSTSTNGIIANYISEYEQILYLESSYFHESEELYLEASQVRALSDADRKVVIDLTNGKLIKAPSGLHLEELKTTNNMHHFIFHIELDEKFDSMNHSYQVLSSLIMNEEGEEVASVNSIGTSNPDGRIMETKFSIPRLEEERIILEIVDYPTRLQDTMNVRIK